MNNKIVIVTGANSGIGKSATIKFAEEGYRVIMACRNIDKSQKVQQEIMQHTKNSSVDLIKLDVSSFKSISDFCSEFKNRYHKLDILIHNAGYFQHDEKEYQLSQDNLQLSFATNAIGPFLMTQLLTDMLTKSEDARVLSSCTTNIRHFFDPKRKIDFDNLQGELIGSRAYNSYKMYGDSKIALLMLTFKLAEKYKEVGIKINAVQIPAIKISKETIGKFNSVWKYAAIFQSFFSASPETMAETYFYICTSEEFKDITGKLINAKREIMQSSHYTSGLIQEIKQFFDSGVYPKYADELGNIESVLDFTNNFIKNSK